MDELDEMLNQAKERNAETEQQLRTIEQEQEERIKQERESRERLSKAIGERFPNKKGKVALELESYFKEQDEAKRLSKRIDLAKSMGITLAELDVYLQRGEKK